MKNFEHIAYMTNGSELVRTTCGEFANETALPEIQVVRGSDMWDAEKSLAFGADLTAGKYPRPHHLQGGCPGCRRERCGHASGG